MFGIYDFGVFLFTGILLNFTPGPDTCYILGRGLAQGRGAALASVLGISTGSVIHTLAAACGLSALLAASAYSFFALKLAGGAYLIYLGSRLLFSRECSTAIPAAFPSARFREVYWQGLITNVLNPKVALFFLAFMPQFIREDSSSKFTAFIALGLCFITTGTLWCFCLAWFSSLLGERLRGNTILAKFLNRTAGTLFVLLGVRLVAVK